MKIRQRKEQHTGGLYNALHELVKITNGSMEYDTKNVYITIPIQQYYLYLVHCEELYKARKKAEEEQNNAKENSRTETF